MTEEQMEEKLNSVNESYEFFVFMTMCFIEHFGIGEELMDYIDSHDGATASDVTKETYRLVFGEAP